MNYFNKILFYPNFNLNELPDRNVFLNQNEIEISNERIKKKKPLIFIANYVSQYYLKKDFRIMLIGHLLCGTKTSVILNNLEIYIDLFSMYDCISHRTYNDIPADKNGYVSYEIIKTLEKNNNFSRFKKSIDTLCSSYQLLSVNYKFIKKQIYQIGVGEYYIGVRIFFNDNKLYRDVAKYAYRNENLFVASYNENDIINKIGAQYDIYMGSWMIINEYDVIDTSEDSFYYTKAEYNFDVNIKNYNKIQSEDLIDYGINESYLEKIKSLYISLDIETVDIKGSTEEIQTEKENGSILSYSNQIFNIGLSIALECDKKSKPFNIGIICYDDGNYHNIKPLNDSLIIVTKSPKDNLLVLIDIFERLQPDFILTYNGLNFDIPQILLSMRLYNIFDLFFSRVSILKSHDLAFYPNTKYVNGIQYRYNSNKNGNLPYTYWNNVFTTTYVSGLDHDITHCSPKIRSHSGVKQFKITNDKSQSYHYINIPGIIMLDVFLISWKKHSKDNVKVTKGGSMNYYLKVYGINQKLDMEYWKLWAIYKLTSQKNMKDFEGINIEEKILQGESIDDLMLKILEYCNYDSTACRHLFDTYDYIEEKRSYCQFMNLPLETNIYKADTAKVESGLRKTLYKKDFVAIENKFYINTDTSSNENRGTTASELLKINPNLEFYHINKKAPRNEGAYVEIHKTGKILINYKGHNFNAPIEAEDFSSLYPSIEWVYNMCPSTIKENENQIPSGMTYHKMEFDDFPEAYKNKKFYIVSHENNKKKYSVLAEFFEFLKSNRNYHKKLMGNANDEFDQLLSDYTTNDYTYEQHKIQYPNDSVKDYNKFCNNYLYQNNEKYKNAKIKFANENSKQNALKISMNSTYGYLDYYISIFYQPVIAMLTTYFGRKFIKMINDICYEFGKTVIYNDTDSVYYHHSIETFQDIFDKYLDGKINKQQLDKKLVLRSMKTGMSRSNLTWFYKKKIKNLEIESQENPKILARIQAIKEKLLDKSPLFEDILNQRIEEYTNSKILGIVREESLYPAIYLSKKKYLGVVHTDSYRTSYTLDTLLIRGIAVRTGNCTGFLKDFSQDLIYECIDSNRNIREIVFEKLNKLFNYKINDLSKLENVAKYKPGTKNKVYGLIERVKLLQKITSDPKLRGLYKIPFELESVYFIYTKQGRNIDICGRKVKINKAEKAEYPEVVKYLNLEPDLHEYIESVLSACAQFLSYDKTFDGYQENMKIKDYLPKIKKYLEKYCKDIYKQTEEFKLMNQFNLDYKIFYSNYKFEIERKIHEKYPTVSCFMVFMINVKYGISFYKKLYTFIKGQCDTKNLFDKKIYKKIPENIFTLIYNYYIELFLESENNFNIIREITVKKIFNNICYAVELGNFLLFEVPDFSNEFINLIYYYQQIFLNYLSIRIIGNNFHKFQMKKMELDL